MSVFNAELSIIKMQIGKAASEALSISGSCGSLVTAESYLRSPSKNKKLRDRITGEIEAILPGLSAILEKFNTNKNAGLEIRGILESHLGHLDSATHSYLAGLVLEGLIKHNKVVEAKDFAVSSSGTVSSVHGLRWSYFSAKTFLALNDTEKALSATNHFIGEFPDAQVPFLHLRGLIHRQTGQDEQAVEDLLTCLKLDPTFIPPVYALYFLVQKNIALDECMEVLSNAVKTNPEILELTSLLADVYTAKGKVDLAIPLYVEASKMATIKSMPALAEVAWPEKAASKPNFIIIGTPKSGTTSAYAYMKHHPSVLGATVKEISFFGNDQKYALGIDWYMSHFPSLAGTNGYITGEASPGYFYSNEARERIAKHFPDTKLILFLRSPSARAISGYYQRKKMNGKIAEIGDYFDDQFKKAEGKKAYQLSRENGALSGGVYFPTLKLWFGSFSKDSILVIKAEDLFEKPAQVMSSIYRHLGVDDIVGTGDFPVSNKGLYPPAPEELISKLEMFYEPHNSALYKMIDRDLGW